MANLLSSVDIKNLRTAVAPRRYESAVMAEANAAHHALVCEIVHEVNIKPAWHAWVENCVPVLALALEVRWELVRLEIRQLISDAVKVRVGVLEVCGDLSIRIGRWRWARNARRARIWVRLTLLRSCRSTEATTDAWLTWARRSGWRRWLWAVACTNH